MENTNERVKFVRTGKKRLSTAALFSFVYEELYTQLSDTLSAEDILNAASDLVRISRGEYKQWDYREAVERPHYFSRNVAEAIDKRQWELIANEFAIHCHCSYPDYNPESLEKFREINLGIHESKWEF